ncbi:porin family protein [Catalinimonas sp. 4WD22]|uniref:porin family protein n=1 Tax=Catalinimonas locisalis TaxID=3133978 RepID=UPI00310192BF
MKTFLIILITMPLWMHPLFAQEEDSTQIEKASQDVEQAIDQAEDFAEKNMNFGIRAGLNFSSLNDNEVLNSDPQTGLHLGFFGRYQFSRRLSAKAELIYSMQGARDDDFSIFEEYSVNLNYLRLPILAEFMVTNNLRIEIGPYVAVLLSSRQSFSDLQAEGGNELIMTDKAETNYVDAGMGIGASYEFPSGFGLGARYTQGFADALGNDFFGGASGSNTIFQTSAYFTF